MIKTRKNLANKRLREGGGAGAVLLKQEVRGGVSGPRALNLSSSHQKESGRLS